MAKAARLLAIARRIADRRGYRNHAILPLNVAKTTYTGGRAALSGANDGGGISRRAVDCAAPAFLGTTNLFGVRCGECLDRSGLVGVAAALGGVGAGRSCARHAIYRRHIPPDALSTARSGRSLKDQCGDRGVDAIERVDGVVSGDRVRGWT